jgi:MFS family permease
MFTNAFSVLIPLYGMLGLWTSKVGYHHIYDFWLYNIVFGLFQAPYYAYSQTMMSEVTPRGYENMFFGLFGITNRASSIIGPNVIQGIINTTNNNWMGFPFLFVLCLSASIIVWFVDVEKGRESCRVYVEKRKLLRLSVESGMTAEEFLEFVSTVEIAVEDMEGSGRESGDSYDRVEVEVRNVI